MNGQYRHKRKARNRPGRPTLFGFLWILGVLPMASMAAEVCFDSKKAHQCLSNDNPVAACSDTLDADPYNLSVRFALCDAHLRRGAPMMALITLDHGLQLCGRSEANCARLQKSVDAVERTSGQRPGSAELRAEHAEDRNTCTRRHIRGNPIYPTILACEQALIAFPKDADLHAAHGEKLLLSKQPARAVLAFRRALNIRPGDPNFLSWHDAAEDSRKTMVEHCLRHTELDRCNRAILPGTQDEAKLHLHRTKLYLQQGDKDAALESLLIVQILDPNNREVSQQLLQLVPAGSKVEEDRLYLARGQAQLARGNWQAAMTDLKRVRGSALERSAAQAGLQQARQQRAAVVQSQCFDARNLSKCKALLIPGEPDEQQIRGFIASLDQPRPKPVVKPKPTPVTTPEVIAESAPAKSTPTTTAPEKPARVQLAAHYSNKASAQGVTH